jgi:hypothetical protein
MSDLEQTNIPLIGNLMQDVGFSLNGIQQYHVATWAVKMSMIGDFLARGHRSMFFNQSEREQFRVATNLPQRTHVWIARHTLPDHIGFWSTDSWALDKTVHVLITSVLVGHLVVQVITSLCTDKWDGVEVMVDTSAGPRAWPEMLTDVWPTQVSAAWPPAFSFKNDGQFSLLHLVRRYSYGENVLKQ